jgi:hypothetical protein
MKPLNKKPLNKKTVSLFLLLFGLGILIVYATMATRFGKAQINPVAPVSVSATTPPWTSKSSSTVSLDVTVTPSALHALIERLVPVRETGSKPEDLGRLLSDEKIIWDFVRGGINLSTSGGLSAETRINGTVQILGKTRPLGVRFSQSARLQGHIAIATKPALTQDWRLNPNALLTLSVTDADLILARIVTVSVRSLVNREVQPEVQKLIARLNSDIASDPFLETEIREIHEQLCQTRTFNMDDTTAWLKTVPVEWIARQPVLDEQGLTLSLGVKLDTWSGTAEPQAEPDCPFPATLNIVPTDNSGDIELKLASSIAWEPIRDAANKQLTKLLQKTDSTFSNEFGTVKMASAYISELRADGQMLLIKLQFEASLDSWLHRSFSGNVWLKGKPVLDRSSQTLSFDDVQLDIASEKALSTLAAFGLVAGPTLEKRLNSLEPISLAKAGKRASLMANAAITKIVEELETADIEVLSDAVNDTRLEDLHIGNDGLDLLVVAKGKLSLRISDIRLDSSK